MYWWRKRLANLFERLCSYSCLFRRPPVSQLGRAQWTKWQTYCWTFWPKLSFTCFKWVLADIVKVLRFLHNCRHSFMYAISLKQQYYADTACTLTLTAMTSTKRHICCLILRIVASSFLATLVHVRNSVFLRQDLRLVTYDVIKMEC